MALLKDSLRPASFRGVPFHVDASEMETGRRTQVHEYPQRDKPFAQDMGRSTRRIEFEAFVVGADYVAKTNALLGAMETAGPGSLIHPWFGTLQVSVVGCRVAFDRALGYARFSLSFVEAGELAFPSAASSTAALSRQAASALESGSVSAFSKLFSALGTINYVATTALSVYSRVLTFLANPVGALANQFGYGSLPGNLTSLFGLFGTPLALGWNFAGLLSLSSKAPSLTASASTPAARDKLLTPAVTGLVRMTASPALAAPAAAASTTSTAIRLNKNETAIVAHARQLLLVQAVGLSSYLSGAVYDDVIGLRSALAAALDTEAMVATDDTLYQALTAARTAMWHDLTERSRDSARLVTLTPPDVLPMLAIAYDYYEDAGRDADIIARNGVRNPGFVPPSALKLLSR